MVEHSDNKIAGKKSNIEEGITKIEKNDKVYEEKVTHAGILEEIYISPKSSYKESDIAYDSKHPVNCYDKFICIWSALKSW